jgi:methionyl-tRNA synthetase
LHLPYDVPANAFMTIKGGKLSKSRNQAVWLHDLLAQYDPDVIRYYVAAVLPETDDTDFSWQDMVDRVNNELIAAWGNLVHRVLSFAVQHWDNRVPEPGVLESADVAILDQVSHGFATVGELIAAVKLRAALRQAMGLVRAVNGYLSHAPWFGMVKDDKARAGTTVYTALRAVASLNVLLAPFLPCSAERVHAALGHEQPLFGTQRLVTYTESKHTHDALVYEAGDATGRWAASALPPGLRLTWSKPLYKKLDF